MAYLFIHVDKIISVLALVLVGIIVRFLLQINGQRWIMSKSHTLTLILLPIITYVITSVISNNIALSLGMVGALSIVRFRHPVRSPLELTVYFIAITFGIAAAVNIKWVLFLMASLIIAISILIVVNWISEKLLGNSYFNVSFSEGNNYSYLEVVALELIEILEKNPNLTSKKVTNEKVEYFFTSTNFNDLYEVSQELNKNKYIQSYQLKKG